MPIEFLCNYRILGFAEREKSQVQENAREREKKESASGRYFPAATCDSFRSGTIEANASLVMFSCASFK